jgi:hypothetical protein
MPNALRLALVAAISIPTAACDDYPATPAKDPTSDNGATVAALQTELRATEAKLEATRAAATAASSTAPRPRARTAPASGPSLPAFVSGGEQRIECPLGYHAAEADGVGCECASSTDGSIVPASRTEAACSTNGRAEADECIFTCPAEAQSTE